MPVLGVSLRVVVVLPIFVLTLPPALLTPPLGISLVAVAKSIALLSLLLLFLLDVTAPPLDDGAKELLDLPVVLGWEGPKYGGGGGHE